MTTPSDLPEFDNHELTSFIFDKKSGLRGFIAIHNTNLGSATGGTRYWQYASDEEALRDTLRLSRAMTYKCALAGVPYGGGKAVIIGDPRQPKSKALLEAYAARVNLLSGNFYTGEDVGTTQADVDALVAFSPYIIGRSNMAGDPGPWAALGVFTSLKVALKAVFGSEDLAGRTIAIKGLGKVGFNLALLINRYGGTIIGADINENVAKSAKKRIKNMKIVSPSEIHKQEADVYSPNALGHEITEGTINDYRCAIICGGANNQLASDAIGAVLWQRGILYVPDFIANAGGLINVVAELDKEGYSTDRVRERVEGIGKTVSDIIALAKRQNASMNVVANKMAEDIFKKRQASVPYEVTLARAQRFGIIQ